MTYCTGKRAGQVSPWSRSTWTPSRCSSSDGPSYQGIASLRCTTLSPCSAAIGIAVTSGSAPKRLRRASVGAAEAPPRAAPAPRAGERRDVRERAEAAAQVVGERGEVAHDVGVDPLVVRHEVHLVHGQDQ